MINNPDTYMTDSAMAIRWLLCAPFRSTNDHCCTLLYFARKLIVTTRGDEEVIPCSGYFIDPHIGAAFILGNLFCVFFQRVPECDVQLLL
jgi:hypothetical protein